MLVKVPAITLGFWIIKIFCTTLGETGGDMVTMTFNWGYLAGTALFLSLLVILVILQIRAKKFSSTLYWATIIASTTAGTTIADFVDRSLGVGYAGGVIILISLVLITLFAWYKKHGSISVDTVSSAGVEWFYWATITFSQTLGTALGDWMADTNSFGYLHASFVFGAGLIILAILYYRTKISRAVLFWGAFILTRPLGATVGDFLDKPIAKGGLNFSRPIASLVLLLLVIALIMYLPQRPAERAH